MWKEAKWAGSRGVRRKARVKFGLFLRFALVSFGVFSFLGGGERGGGAE